MEVEFFNVLAELDQDSFSISFAEKGRLMTGLKLLWSLGSAPGILRMGVTWPSWRESGTQSHEREALMILVQKGETMRFNQSKMYKAQKITRDGLEAL